MMASCVFATNLKIEAHAQLEMDIEDEDEHEDD
jgi:hypothetical protein